MWRYLEGGKRLAAPADTDKRKKQKASYEEKREAVFEMLAYDVFLTGEIWFGLVK